MYRCFTENTMYSTTSNITFLGERKKRNKTKHNNNVNDNTKKEREKKRERIRVSVVCIVFAHAHSAHSPSHTLAASKNIIHQHHLAISATHDIGRKRRMNNIEIYSFLMKYIIINFHNKYYGISFVQIANDAYLLISPR